MAKRYWILQNSIRVGKCKILESLNSYRCAITRLKLDFSNSHGWYFRKKNAVDVEY